MFFFTYLCQMERDDNELLDLKRKLYLKLLSLSEDDITDKEVDIMFMLADDHQIQALLNKRINSDDKLRR